MITEEVARKQLETLHQEGSALAEEFGAEQLRRRKLYGKRAPKETPGLLIVHVGLQKKEKKKKEEDQVPEPPPADETHFEERYQSWYSRVLPLMKQLAQDRYAEFQSFYVVDHRYPWGDTSAYVIQDYLRGRESDDAGEETARCFKNQLAILKSILDRLTWGQMDTADQAERGLQLAFLETARSLMNINERSAGALAGTVLETHLKKVAVTYRLKFRKQTPSIREYVEGLKTAKVLDIAAHSQAIWLAEIDTRSRSEGESPTKQQVRDLIDGARWLITNVF
ncbi:MAG TPA: hypothetical protein VGT99_08555 [Gammaproteobacteria bacterium]|nr:hypothetical protein [Gammaproteobacteria bacterium]